MELPQDFIDRTQPLLGDGWSDFVEALQLNAPTSIRVNTSKLQKEVDTNLSKVPWCTNGYYLEKRPQFTFDPLLHTGAFYVQEASSMFLEQAVKQLISGDVRSLDLCAAPGGKSTLLSSLLSPNSLLVSNEIVRSRAYVLAENLMKWGNPNHVVTNNKPEDYSDLKHFFDVILVDAPCSGEGMFRKDPQSITEWSADNVLLCAQRQKDIISSIWNTLKPGGFLFYSTCTYNREENENLVTWITEEYDASIIELDVPADWGVTESEVNGKSTYHFYPHKTKGEGFFFAVIQKGKDEEIDSRIFRPKKDKRSKKEVPIPQEYKSFLDEGDNFILFESQGSINAFPKEKYSDLQILNQCLKVVSQGVCMGQIKGKDFIPNQSLALSNSLNKSAFERYDVDWNTAISYLRSEAIVLPNCAKGYVLLTYKNSPLGFVKNLGNRANNLYPNEWRIRSGNIPEQEVAVL